MITWQFYETEEYLRHLYMVSKNVSSEDRKAVLPALEDEMQRHYNFIAANRREISALTHYTRILSDEITHVDDKLAETKSKLYNELFVVFLHSHQQIASDLAAAKDDCQSQKYIFNGFFSTVMAKMGTFVEQIGEAILPVMAGFLHTFLMQTLTFDGFQEANPALAHIDEAIPEIAGAAIADYAIASVPPNVAKLFNSPQLFRFAVHALKRAAAIELPLEAIAEIVRCTELLADLYRFETDSFPGPDELTPLVDFVLVTSGIGNVVSFCKYLEHYLADLGPAGAALNDDRRVLALSQLQACVTALSEMIAEE